MFSRRTLEQLLEAARAAWRGWLDCFHYSGPREPLVRRSAITRRVGLASEAWAFLAWVLALIQGGSRPAVLYDLDGRVPAEEWIDPQLEGYRATAPMRWSNAAGWRWTAGAAG